MSSSNCCFLTCIHVSQEAGQVVWHSHLFQNFSQFSRLDSISCRSELDYLSLSEGLSQITMCENTIQNSDTQVNFISLVLIYSFHACLLAEVLQSCLILWDSMDRSLSGSSVHGMEWVVVPSFKGSFQPRDPTCISYISCIGRWVLYHQRHLGNPIYSLFVQAIFSFSLDFLTWMTQNWTKNLQFCFLGSFALNLANEGVAWFTEQDNSVLVVCNVPLFLSLRVASQGTSWEGGRGRLHAERDSSTMDERQAFPIS